MTGLIKLFLFKKTVETRVKESEKPHKKSEFTSFRGGGRSQAHCFPPVLLLMLSEAAARSSFIFTVDVSGIKAS